MTYCSQCGTDLATDAKFCPECGTPISPVVTPAVTPDTNIGVEILSPPRKKRLLPPILSLLFCGLGQFYNRDILEGLGFLLWLGIALFIFQSATFALIIVAISIADAYTYSDGTTRKYLNTRL